jgi:uncharacterized protein YcbK (DUF882 family)
MKARNLTALPLWLAPCVCLPLMLLFPREAEPTPHAPAVVTSVVTAPAAAIAEEVAAPAPMTVHVVLTRGRQRLEIDLPLDGKVSPEIADDIARIMRCRISGRTRRIATGTLALLADVAVRFPGREIEVISAVRAEPDRTREGIKHSKHWSGHAIDIMVRGAKLSDVRDEMWQNHKGIGVGWYPAGGFIHLDYRPESPDTAWTQARPNADNHYNPRWSRIARDPSAVPAVVRARLKSLLETAALVPFVADAIGYRETSRKHRPSS